MDINDITERAAELAAEQASLEGPLLPALHAVQREFGYIPEDAIPGVAKALSLSRADVHGVVSFYTAFRTTPPGRHRLLICRAESCRAMGAEALEARARAHLGIDYHQTSDDQRFTLEPVYCLGNCTCSPNVVLDGDLHARVTPEQLDALLESAK